MTCRHCGSELKLPFVDLGSSPPSNAYLTREALQAPEKWYPLRVMVCENCWLVQTEDYIGAAELFSDDYAYFSSTAKSWLSHASSYVAAIVNRLRLGSESCVAEIAANDGYLLQFVRERGIPCFGVEPTKSTAASARAKGIPIVEKFFGASLAAEFVAEGRQADLVVANNVLAHVPDINDFVTGIAALLKPTGVATFEFPSLLNLVRENQFDTIYHEHYSYLSFTAVHHIFRGNGLAVVDVEVLPTHGGSLRVFAQRIEASGVAMPIVAKMLAQERAVGMTNGHFYANFQSRADGIKNALLEFVLQQKKAGLKVGAYGAAAKGNTLLNFAGMRRDLLPYVVDRNPMKQGRFLPGSRIPILNEEYLLADQPDWVIILPWNLREEIEKQLAVVREWGGRFVQAVPKLEII